MCVKVSVCSNFFAFCMKHPVYSNVRCAWWSVLFPHSKPGAPEYSLRALLLILLARYIVSGFNMLGSNGRWISNCLLQNTTLLFSWSNRETRGNAFQAIGNVTWVENGNIKRIPKFKLLEFRFLFRGKVVVMVINLLHWDIFVVLLNADKCRALEYKPHPLWLGQTCHIFHRILSKMYLHW